MYPSPGDPEGLSSLPPALACLAPLQVLMFAFLPSSAGLTHRQWAFFFFTIVGQDLGKVGRWAVPNPTPFWCWVRITFLWWWQTARLAWVTTLQSPVNSGRLLWKLVGMEDLRGGDSGWSTAWQLLTTSAFGVPSTRGWKETRVFFFKFLTAVELIYNGVLVSGVRQSDSVGHIHISILFLILFPYRSLQNAEQSSPFNPVGCY